MSGSSRFDDSTAHGSAGPVRSSRTILSTPSRTSRRTSTRRLDSSSRSCEFGDACGARSSRQRTAGSSDAGKVERAVTEDEVQARSRRAGGRERRLRRAFDDGRRRRCRRRRRGRAGGRAVARGRCLAARATRSSASRSRSTPLSHVTSSLTTSSTTAAAAAPVGGVADWSVRRNAGSSAARSTMRRSTSSAVAARTPTVAWSDTPSWASAECTNPRGR